MISLKRFVFLVCLMTFLLSKTATAQDAPQQTLEEVKAENKDKQERLKTFVKDLDKKRRLQMPIFRRYGRNIKDIVFDFDTKKFVWEPGLSDTLNTPPYEIHEMDGISIKIKNINPFIYSVDLFEMQGDQISNEKLLEASQKNSLELQAEPFKEIDINVSMSSVAASKCDSAQYIKLKASLMLLEKSNDQIQTLQNELQFNQDRATRLEYSLKNKITLPDIFEAEPFSTLDEAGIKRVTYELTMLGHENIIKKAKLTDLQAKIKGQSLADIETKLTKETEALKKSCVDTPGQLQKKLSRANTEFKLAMIRINHYIFFHNQLIRAVKSPVNDYGKIKLAVSTLYKGIGVTDPHELPAQYFTDNKKVLLLTDSIINIIQQLGLLIKPQPEDHKEAIFTLSAFRKDFLQFDHEKLVSQIVSITELIDPKFFELNYQTLSIAENADYVKYRLEFKPNVGTSIQSQAPYNLDISFFVNEGLKIDVSTGLVLDYNLADPKYFFRKYTVVEGGISYDSAKVIKSKGTGNITPSLNLMLNGYKRSSYNFKVGASMGIGFSSDIKFRLYAGPSLIIGRKERIVITGGIAFGPVMLPSDGYEAGKKFQNNSALPAEVPMVQDKYKFGWYTGVGFNLTGKDTKGLLEKIKFK